MVLIILAFPVTWAVGRVERWRRDRAPVPNPNDSTPSDQFTRVGEYIYMYKLTFCW
jgi:hypothetical protein